MDATHGNIEGNIIAVEWSFTKININRDKYEPIKIAQICYSIKSLP
jgi:hypothetical protein